VAPQENTGSAREAAESRYRYSNPCASRKKRPCHDTKSIEAGVERL
jgi:hypothetical protein